MLDKTFDPKTAEPRLYAAWEASGAFAPTDDPAAEREIRALAGARGAAVETVEIDGAAAFRIA